MSSPSARAPRPLSSISATPGSRSLQRPRHAASPVLNAESAYKIGHDGYGNSFVSSKGRPQGRVPGTNIALNASEFDVSLNDLRDTHLLTQGFLSGKYSDITIHAFGRSYRLHRIILDKAPYFASLLGGSWREEGASELALSPEDMDVRITQQAFEHVIRGLYGDSRDLHEYQDAIELLPVASWLGLRNLVELLVAYLVENIDTSRVSQVIQIATDNYYGAASDRLMSAAKAVLFRQGWEMPYEHWNNIPAGIVRDIVGGDAFYVPGEWERWFLTTKILNKRLRGLGVMHQIIDAGGRYLVIPRKQKHPSAIRSHAAIDHDHLNDPWTQLYLDPELVPLYELLDHGILYMHIRFERLHQIRNTRDIFGTPFLPIEITSNAVWMAEELRLKIEVAKPEQTCLNLDAEGNASRDTTPEAEAEVEFGGKGKNREYLEATTSSTQIPSYWARTPTRYRIPKADMSCIYTGRGDTDNLCSDMYDEEEGNASSDGQPNDPFVYTTGSGATPTETYQSGRSKYTSFAPFRFSIQFPHPRALREKKRMYSHTVWYAGSFWNLYIQRVNTTKAQQLGVYLHRVKDRDHVTQLTDHILSFSSRYRVDDRTGQLERDLNRLPISVQDSLGIHDTDVVEVLDSAINRSQQKRGISSASADASPNRAVRPRSSGQIDDNEGLEAESDSETPPQSLARHEKLKHESPFYVAQRGSTHLYTDTRPTIKTYFKIYSPTKNGQQISMYESAPDNFEFGKSWGWRSSSMVFDDSPPSSGARNDGGKLRFMVVLGNI